MFPTELKDNFTVLAQTLANILENPSTPGRIKDAITAFDCDLHAVLPPTEIIRIQAAEMRAGLPLSLSAITESAQDNECISPQMADKARST